MIPRPLPRFTLPLRPFPTSTPPPRRLSRLGARHRSKPTSGRKRGARLPLRASSRRSEHLSALFFVVNNALAWWKHLCESDELPKTWNDVKILMRKSFADSSPASNLNFEIHSLEEEEATIASPIVHNILQEVEIK
jgi:hypothetical protein